MGSPASEVGRDNGESPQHRVTIGYALAVGKFDVTRGEYAAFVAAANYKPKNDIGCDIDTDGHKLRAPAGSGRTSTRPSPIR